MRGIHEPIWPILLFSLPLGYAKNRLLRNGFTSVPAFENVTYNAVDYIPSCGFLGLVNSSQYTYYDNTDLCHKGMATYRLTKDVSGLYDSVGNSLDTQIGMGDKLCLCFSLAGNLGMMDLCLGIDGDASIMETCCEPEDVGVYQPGKKALPQCETASTSLTQQISKSQLTIVGLSDATIKSEASRTNIRTGSLSTTLSTLLVDSLTKSTMSMSSATSSSPLLHDQGHDLNQSDKLALGVGLGMGLPAIIIAATGLYFTYKRVSASRAGRLTSS